MRVIGDFDVKSKNWYGQNKQSFDGSNIVPIV